ncbi:MAG: dihydrodipicolinate synthase family protein [Fimbriimonas sp.]|nr:dihydrodipicolinate synthase family protein [Fimbriimonas sp.]
MKAGVYPAGVTPFDAKGAIDFAALARLLAWFRAGECHGVVLAGTNGEGPSLSAVEKRDLVKAGVELAEGLEVVLGISTPSLDEAIWLCKQSYSAGAHAVLLMAPGFFRDASTDAIAKWYEAVLDKSPIGVLVYNFPGKTGITLPAETMHRLSKHHRMIGLKDSSGNRDNVAAYKQALEGTGKCLMVGNETLLVETLAAGWTGTISGAANLIPGWLSQVVREWPVDRESAETKFALIEPTLQAIRSCPQPASNKRILADLGVLPSPDVRLPLESPSLEQVGAPLNLVRSLVS